MTGLVDELEALIPFLESHHCSAEPIRKAVAQMTTVSPDKDEVERVTQADRDAAATLARAGAPGLGNGNKVAASDIKGGLCDDYFIVKMFAQHRIAAMSPVDRPLDMCTHGADRDSYCGYCGGYSTGAAK